MRYHNPHKRNGTITTKVVCAVVFLLFSFLWLYEFQADVLAVAQHVMSDGVTHYDRTVGALLITFVLMLLQLGVAAVIKLSRRTHALTYLPSMLILALISDISPDIDSTFSFGAWKWGVPLILLLWGGAVWLARQMMPFENDDKQPTGLLSRRVWINMLQMSAMMLFVALAGNSNIVFHYSAHAEVSLMQGDVDEALRVGHESLESNERLTMLRVYALSRKGQLADRLFNYPVVGSSETILPLRMQPQFLAADTIWKYLGARPARMMRAEQYYTALAHDSLATAAVADYRLCGLLIDRNLDAFVSLLPRYYEVADSLPLPRHYQEALVLYKHLRTNPAIVYHHPVIDEDWENLQQLEAAYPLETERKYQVFEHYGGSYWYYYSYTDSFADTRRHL